MKDSFADVRLTAGTDTETRAVAVPIEERAFSIAILGDFSGRGTRTAEPGARHPNPRPILVDRDDFDDVLARLAPTLHLRLPESDGRFEARFRELDDFHPDGLWDRLPLFRELRDLRARLVDPGTFRQAAAELRGGDAPESRVAPTAPSAAAPLNLEGILDRVLDVSAPAAIEPDTGDVLVSDRDFRAYVGRIVAPHLVADADPRQAETIARVDAITSEQMRSVLHHPDFQALESLWRGVFLLTRRLPTGAFLRVYLIDVSKEELWVDLLAEDGTRTPLRELLTRGPENGARGPWSLLVGSYSFDPADDDIRSMTELAAVAAAAGAPWISAADPALVGCPSPADLGEPARWGPIAAGWEALRRAPNARWLGLALPRILLRLPYGEDADECERFRFEESPPTGLDHEAYLWGNPALGVALLLGETFDQAGWGMRPGAVREIDGLPLHLVRGNDGASAVPCAEAWLTDEAAERILDAGVMPFASRKDRDSVQLVRFQSVADPLRALNGAWVAR